MNREADYPALRNYIYHRTDPFLMEQAIAIKDQYLPKRIYRYYSCNEQNITAFRQNLVYCANPSLFNDMYDYFMLPDKRKFFKDTIEQIIEDNKDDNELVSMLNTYKNEILDSFDPISYFADLFSKNREMTIRKLQGTMDILINEIKRMAYSDIRICCFSEKIESASLWCDYTQEETGFAISYNVEKIDIRSNLWPVLYNDRKQMSHFSDHSDKEITARKILIAVITKSMEWQHEYEWRLIINKKYLQEERFIAMQPEAIYLGARIDEENQEKLIGLAQKKNIDTFVMQPAAAFLQGDGANAFPGQT